LSEVPLVHCAIHDKFEQPQLFSCLECRHQYPSQKRIIDDYNKMVAEVYRRGGVPKREPPVATKLSQVPFCPLCLHDW
jgi:hypothetical protein